MSGPEDVLQFWFGDSLAERAPKWFVRDKAFDEEIRQRFLADLEHAAQGEYEVWEATPRGRLALVILLDQFSRNLFRGDPASFAQDARARELVQRGLSERVDLALDPVEAAFFYMPLEHSESKEDQALSVEKFGDLRRRARSEDEKRLLESFYDYAVRHRDIVERFGRFPHRNAVLGRSTTDEEAEFLTRPGSSF